MCINLFAVLRLSKGIKRSEKHCFHHLLLSLSICDFTHIILNIICFSLPQLSLTYRSNHLLYAIPFLIPLAQMSLSASSLTTVVSNNNVYLICNTSLDRRKDTHQQKPKGIDPVLLIFLKI